MVAKKVAIIGCGVGGLTAIKCCLDAGLQPTCFEQQSSFGGIWNYTDEPRPGLGSVHSGTVTNISKAIMCFSDFPVPKEWPNYLHHRLFMKYLRLYAENFGLEEYVRFNTKVTKLSKATDYNETGNWALSYTRNTRQAENEAPKNGIQIDEEIFDAVMICTGHLSIPSIPDIPGMKKFQGAKVHSGDYRSFKPYVGKRVVVVGCGSSAGDISIELSLHASQVYLSTRSGGYIVKRLVPGTTKPFDHQITRAAGLVNKNLKRFYVSGVHNTEYDFVRLGLQPSGVLGVNQFGFVNDELPTKIITGRVIVKGELKDLRETSVVFGGEEVLENIDAIIFCTGFKLDFPFAPDIIPVENEHYSRLYKHIFIPEAHHQTLAFIGLIETVGSDVPTWEMQARVAAEVFAGRCVLPSNKDMLAECLAREEQLSNIGRSKEKFLHGVPMIAYMDEITEMIGAKPDLWSIFAKDPQLAYHCLFGPAVPAQYRLQGPNTWEDARKNILSVEDDYKCPLKTMRCSPVVKTKPYFHRNFAVVLIIFLACIFCFLS
ncbi:dimethylaniline monooxygenase [N-oxide-forming] 2-like [Dendronephthya gigantea]|uniref:dimethylaniline monooxygenase [N-oxide-forming] 2-like n=1 Tax=Dendronephthya gigantea TaxID=151771 RepID=UPI00106C9F1F|nr:dimethylaniline monooxygenase [N-oxide-forming] 2-like [Dendronephthya gigantea]